MDERERNTTKYDDNKGTAVQICRVTTKEELQMIKALQEANLGRNLTQEERDQEGFVTAEYTIEFLERMNSFCPSIIAKNTEGFVVGYALVVTRDVYGEHTLLNDLFDEIFSIYHHNQCLKDINFVLVGQLCVAKDYRGCGLVQQMYNYYKEQLKRKNYQCALTDIADSNSRSLKAHKKSGFETIKTFTYDNVLWHIVLLEF